MVFLVIDCCSCIWGKYSPNFPFFKMFFFEGIFDRIPTIFSVLCAVSRHQKKVLALVLAFACAFTMFAGAAFTDEADIKATDAVNMLTALG
ncbi:hypothetical protein, partial [Agathobaculum sp. TL06]